ncbi:MAG: signal peptidase I [Salinivirgaceae bacterium]
MAKRSRKKTIKANVKEWGKALGLSLVLILIVKGVFIQTYLVESPRMEKTLLTGDYVLINKTSYGARLPVTLFSLPLFPKCYVDWVQLHPLRLPGFKHIQVNDLLVFNYPAHEGLPIDKKELMTKRCVALPGDTLLIADKQLSINKQPFTEPATVQYNYRLVTDGSLLNDEFLNRYQISEGGLVSDMGIYDFPFTDSEAQKLNDEPNIRFIRKLKDFPGENTQYVYPMGTYHQNNKDYFGPVQIPFKGQHLNLDIRNLELYRQLIEHFEGNSVSLMGDKIYINGEETRHYTVKQDYYFVMDDNRDNAKDSRYWGFLPHSHVIGKATRVLFSYDTNRNKLRWNRFFKGL